MGFGPFRVKAKSGELRIATSAAAVAFVRSLEPSRRTSYHWKVAERMIHFCMDERGRWDLCWAGLAPAFRKKRRATMRRNIKAIVARLRERKRLYTELGLCDLDQAISDTCIALCELEDTIDTLTPSPNVIVANVLAG
jgi:hypothetical protein